MSQPAPPPFTADQEKIIDSYKRLRTLVAGPPQTPPGVIQIPNRAPGPIISALDPAKGPENEVITIKGTGLLTARKVFFGATEVTKIEIITDPNLGVVVKVLVPHIEPVPVSVRVAVETDCGTALSPVDFTVEASTPLPVKGPRGG